MLKIPNEDTTSNVSFICPKNYYSSELYSETKPTFILIEQEKYFEPVYSYTEDRTDKTQKRVSVQKFFLETDTNLQQGIKILFSKIIKPYLQQKCLPLSSMPSVYKAKRAILLYDLITLLKKRLYSPLVQVMNYHGKIIGLLVQSPDKQMSGFVPCYPSALIENMDYLFMIENDIWNTYDNTISFLKKLSADSAGEIPCLPEFKVIEDEVVVGILTETNQFIQISEPVQVSDLRSDDDLKELNNNNYLIADSEISLSRGQDKERKEYVHKIKLETQFFQSFRNTIRILLNEYENIKMREMIEEQLKKKYILYNNQLDILVEMLKRLINKRVLFVDNYDLSMVKEVSSCIMNDDNIEKCSAKFPYCTVSTDVCQLLIPRNNLITNGNNEEKYYMKMADELIRYTRIKSFIFEPNSYLSIGNVDYNLREDELIVIESIVTQAYFDNLIPANENKYIKYNTRDQAEPQTTQYYSNLVEV